jgi:hypothetical protein
VQKNVDLKRLERKAWTSYHQDGLVDFFLGFLLIAGFIGYNAGDLGRVLGPILQLSSAGFLILSKKLVTVPRMGLVEFGPERKARKRKTALIATVAVLATVALLVLTLTGNIGWIRDNHTAFSILLGVGIWLVFSFFAYMQDFQRLYTLGALFATTITLSELLDTSIPILVAGVAACISGLILFKRFLGRYPLPTEAELGSNG